MKKQQIGRQAPAFAIVESNTLAVMGLSQLLESAIPSAQIQAFGTFGELQASNPEHFIHFFVSMQIVLANRNFFLDYKHKTIVLTPSNDPMSQLSVFSCVCSNDSGKCSPCGCPFFCKLMSSLMSNPSDTLTHRQWKSFSCDIGSLEHTQEKTLTDREIEVLSLVAKGKINKEIADLLCIGLTTVITHRKNIQEKLGIKSVSALTIYAVMHGFVDINHI